MEEVVTCECGEQAFKIFCDRIVCVSCAKEYPRDGKMLIDYVNYGKQPNTASRPTAHNLPVYVRERVQRLVDENAERIAQIE